MLERKAERTFCYEFYFHSCPLGLFSIALMQKSDTMLCYITQTQNEDKKRFKMQFSFYGSVPRIDCREKEWSFLVILC